jgi:sRNA-binding carbon storage regulator CsrA
MLILTRKPGQAIIIGGSVRLSVVTVFPGGVRIVLEPMLPVAHTAPVPHALHVHVPLRLSEDVVVLLQRINSGAAVLGIDAPKAVGIDRAEIYYRKQAQVRHA